jgi:hypothetical protein
LRIKEQETRLTVHEHDDDDDDNNDDDDFASSSLQSMLDELLPQEHIFFASQIKAEIVKLMYFLCTFAFSFFDDVPRGTRYFENLPTNELCLQE